MYKEIFPLHLSRFYLAGNLDALSALHDVTSHSLLPLRKLCVKTINTLKPINASDLSVKSLRASLPVVAPVPHFRLEVWRTLSPILPIFWCCFVYNQWLRSCTSLCSLRHPSACSFKHGGPDALGPSYLQSLENAPRNFHRHRAVYRQLIIGFSSLTLPVVTKFPLNCTRYLYYGAAFTSIGEQVRLALHSSFSSRQEYPLYSPRIMM